MAILRLTVLYKTKAAGPEVEKLLQNEIDTYPFSSLNPLHYGIKSFSE